MTACLRIPDSCVEMAERRQRLATAVLLRAVQDYGFYLKWCRVTPRTYREKLNQSYGWSKLPPSQLECRAMLEQTRTFLTTESVWHLLADRDPETFTPLLDRIDREPTPLTRRRINHG